MSDADLVAITEILGYTCETQAPNSPPTTEYVTDTWMKPRRDALIDLLNRARAQAWDEGYECRGSAAAAFGREAPFHLTPPNPYRTGGSDE